MGKGDAEFLKNGEEIGFKVIVIPRLRSEKSCEQYIDSAIYNEGTDGKAFELLGRYFCSGKSCFRPKIGSKMGFPTANIILRNFL